MRPHWGGTRRRLAVVEQERGALAEAQRAFRRVAAFVAQDPPPDQIFATVTRELGELLAADIAHLHRLEGERRWTVAGAWGPAGHLPLGLEWTDDGGVLERTLVAGGRTLRIDDYEIAMLSIAPELRRLGARSSAGAPITVEGRVWGMVAACSCGEPLAREIEPRLIEFAELVGSAVARAGSR